MFRSDISARVLSVVTMKQPNQSNLEHNERTVGATSLNWGTASYESLKNTLTTKVPCNWSLENFRDVWLISQAILVLHCKILWLSIFGCTRSFKLYKLVKVSYKSSDFVVHSHQNKPYPSLCVKPTGRLNNTNKTNTRQKDFSFRIKILFLTHCGSVE